jgi:Holliday junction resolvasome RuvABC endonuclease subunit
MKIGIDYSLSCPAICVNTSNNEFKYNDCTFLYLTNVKKHGDTFNDGNVKFVGVRHDEYTREEQRYDNISNFFLRIIDKYHNPNINLEDYSFASTGRVFHIAENMGLLKYKLFKNDLHYNLLAPSQIKKFATGKGNANKEKMIEAFKEDTGCDLLKIFECNYTSPASDIADSYFICKFINEDLNLSKYN